MKTCFFALLMLGMNSWIFAAPQPQPSSTTQIVSVSWSNATNNTDGTPLTDLAATEIWLQAEGDANGYSLLATVPATVQTSNVALPPGAWRLSVRHANTVGLVGPLSDPHAVTNSIRVPGKPGKVR